MIQIINELPYDPNKKSYRFWVDVSRNNIKEVKRLLGEGQNPNYLTPIFDAASNGYEEIVRLLIEHGAITTFKNANGNTLSEVAKTSEIKFLVSSSNCVLNDMERFYERCEQPDLVLFSQTGNKFSVHKTILRARLKDQKRVELLEEILVNYSDEDVESFLRWIYSGIVGKLEKKVVLNRICKQIDYKSVDWKSTTKGFLSDLKELYHDDKSKNFSIVVHGIEVRVHKEIIMARSELYRQMYLNTYEECTKVTDYSDRSLPTMKVFVKYLYTDKIDLTEDGYGYYEQKEIMQELDDAQNFYQLSDWSKLNLIVDKWFDNKKKTKRVLQEIEMRSIQKQQISKMLTSPQTIQQKEIIEKWNQKRLKEKERWLSHLEEMKQSFESEIEKERRAFETEIMRKTGQFEKELKRQKENWEKKRERNFQEWAWKNLLHSKKN
ncbi:hypothetical protein M0813_27622 [Anaeramoeba flamelloides]|uniref:BTB domain-containing protein n=1 Tax=Anaeramoeba flamelloides TaxID=1746091 RepID=A0ABQ8XWA2_9EUKA|nr:hypothetical protein M0813_27622 [Anaeramoeba flamelloides]